MDCPILFSVPSPSPHFLFRSAAADSKVRRADRHNVHSFVKNVAQPPSVLSPVRADVVKTITSNKFQIQHFFFCLFFFFVKN